MLNIRRSHDRLIFNMGIPIPRKDALYIETGPRNSIGTHMGMWFPRKSRRTPVYIIAREDFWENGASHPYVVHHDDVIKRKHFPRYWPFVWRIHRSPVNSPHKGQWRRALMFSLICAWINDWVNNREADDLGRYRAHCDVTVMHVKCKHQPTPFSDGYHGTLLMIN